MASKSSLDNLLKSVLSIANSEQNFAYSPAVYDNHFNIATAFLIDSLVKAYPVGVDALSVFIKKKLIPVTSGVVVLPDDFRNLLGAPSIHVKPDGSDCSDNNPIIIDSAAEFKTAQLKAGCKTYPLRIVSKEEWDNLTTSKYAFPTYEEPIGLYQGDQNTNGTISRQIKVCPYDLSRVEVMYVRQEKIYRYNYITNPDDTFIFNPVGSVESEWTDAAFSLLFKAVFALYSAYSRDNTIIEYSQILNKLGLF